MMKKVYIITDFTKEHGVGGAWTNPMRAMADFNRKYFGADFHNETEGWTSKGHDVWEFDDEGDKVYVVGLEVKHVA